MKFDKFKIGMLVMVVGGIAFCMNLVMDIFIDIEFKIFMSLFLFFFIIMFSGMIIILLSGSEWRKNG